MIYRCCRGTRIWTRAPQCGHRGDHLLRGHREIPGQFLRARKCLEQRECLSKRLEALQCAWTRIEAEEAALFNCAKRIIGQNTISGVSNKGPPTPFPLELIRPPGERPGKRGLPKRSVCHMIEKGAGVTPTSSSLRVPYFGPLLQV